MKNGLLNVKFLEQCLTFRKSPISIIYHYHHFYYHCVIIILSLAEEKNNDGTDKMGGGTVILKTKINQQRKKYLTEIGQHEIRKLFCRCNHLDMRINKISGTVEKGVGQDLRFIKVITVKG